jgi:hypothetical protein
VDLEPAPNNKKIYEISRLQNRIVKIEPPHSNKNIIQCMRDANNMAIPKLIAICHMFVLNVAVHIIQQIVGNPETPQPDAPFAGVVTPQITEVVITSGS